MMLKKKNVGFIGRGELGIRVLKRMLKNDLINISFVIVCDHSKEVGSSKKVFKKLATLSNIRYFETNKINNEKWVNFFKKEKLDFCVALLWLYTLHHEIINTTKKGFINLHPGLLPKYRGNACLNWAIMNDEKFHGITAHLMKAGELDSGPILVQRKYDLPKDAYVGDIIKQNLTESVDITVEAINLLLSENYKIKKQRNSEALYCYPRLPRDGEINWSKSSKEIYKLIRAAGKPYPGAYSFFEDIKDKKIKKLIIHKAEITENIFDFNAFPGHIIKTDNSQTRSVVCGDNKLIKLLEIEINNKVILPTEIFRSVRQRLGLDYSSLLYKILNT